MVEPGERLSLITEKSILNPSSGGVLVFAPGVLSGFSLDSSLPSWAGSLGCMFELIFSLLEF